jgi:tetratricopeptide (TPR) repeat protein
MYKKTILFAFLLGFFVANAQICDTMDVKKTEHLGKEYQKCKERLWAKKDIGITDADKIFDIAVYVRQKNDTSYKTWYKWALSEYKKDFDRRRDDKGGNHKKASEHLYRIGLCYFYMEKYDDAVNFLAKVISAKYYNACAYYYISFAKKKQGKDKEAEDEFKKFEQLTKPPVPEQEKKD